MAHMTFQLDDLKNLDKRVQVESKKAKDLATAMTKIKEQLEADRKSNCLEFRKHFQVFASGAGVVHTARMKLIFDDFCLKIDSLEKSYNQAISHINDVPVAHLNGLATKLQNKQKTIKKDAGSKEAIKSFMEFEWDRIETIKLSIMHFANANMFLNARATEIYNAFYQALQDFSFEQEFQGESRQNLSDIMKRNQIEQRNLKKSTDSSGNQSMKNARARSHGPPEDTGKSGI